MLLLKERTRRAGRNGYFRPISFGSADDGTDKKELDEPIATAILGLSSLAALSAVPPKERSREADRKGPLETLSVAASATVPTNERDQRANRKERLGAGSGR